MAKNMVLYTVSLFQTNWTAMSFIQGLCSVFNVFCLFVLRWNLCPEQASIVWNSFFWLCELQIVTRASIHIGGSKKMYEFSIWGELSLNSGRHRQLNETLIRPYGANYETAIRQRCPGVLSALSRARSVSTPRAKRLPTQTGLVALQPRPELL